MRVLLLSPWDNAWIPYLRAEFERRGAEFEAIKPTNSAFSGMPDLVLHGWANGLSRPIIGARNVMFLRRYELFDHGLSKTYWSRVDQLICVNAWIADRVRETFCRQAITVPVTVIYNGVDVDKWTFKTRKAGTKIGMACHVHPKKNLPLAVQILAALPEDYELHIAGDVQDACTAEYLNHIGKTLRRTVYLYDHIAHEQMDGWWENMDYCLSSSLSEGNPNNVIEAMAKGIRPVIHDWPGADEQFPAWARFASVKQAVHMIRSPVYDSQRYRDLVRERFGVENYAKVADLCESLLEKEAA